MSRPRPLCIVDYGAGNLRSVQKAFLHVGVDAAISGDVETVSKAPALVLPGVGAFGAAMDSLERTGLREALLLRIQEGTPFLGVCLGLQVLLDSSEEDPGVRGFGLVAGEVRALPDSVKVPHIGWNQVEVRTDSDLFAGIPDGSAFYFVHGYAAAPESADEVLGVTDYDGVELVSAVEKDNVAGVQFHPEKSSSLGLRFYRNFAHRAGLVGAL